MMFLKEEWMHSTSPDMIGSYWLGFTKGRRIFWDRLVRKDGVVEVFDSPTEDPFDTREDMFNWLHDRSRNNIEILNGRREYNELAHIED